MKKQLIYFIIFLLSFQIIYSQNPDITGYVRNYAGVLFETGDFSILQNSLNLNIEKMGDKVAFKANPILYHFDNNRLDLRLRELYMDMYFKNFDLRIGQQQIVWGKADGTFITDIVSPLNLTEFLLPDFDEIRTGVFATKLDYYIGNHTVEVILIPVFTPTEMPQAGSIWYIQPEFPAPATFDWSKSKIPTSLENSEFFAKYTALTSAIDFEVMGGYTWDDNPTMHIKKEFGIDATTTPPQPMLTGLKITPEYHRLTLGGGSFSTEIKGIILRGEGAYYNGKYFQINDPDPLADGTIKKNYLHYLIGVDFNIADVKLSSQFIQQNILDYNDLMANKQVENTMTFLARMDFMRETLHMELFSYIGLTNQDALIRPKITYDFDDSFSILLGSNIFIGETDGRFGKYADNSMIYTKIKYSF